LNLIERDALKAKIDAGEIFKLVMVLGAWAYRAKHIPGSLNIDDPTKILDQLDPSEEIIVYCSDFKCPASKYVYKLLTESGYQNVTRYAGGISDWEEHGLPMEGEWAE
jgi:rhodanese-related sulfurtransferase